MGLKLRVKVVAAVAMAVAAAMVSGCGGAQHAPITTPADDAKANGIRYYEPARYVLMYADGKGGVKGDWLTLPDQTQLMAVDPTVYLASGNTTLEFTNGMLLKQDDTVDATAVPAAAVTAFETVLKAVATAVLNQPGGVNNAGSYRIPAPRLYKLVCNAAGQWSLSGQYSTVPVLITLPSPETK